MITDPGAGPVAPPITSGREASVVRVFASVLAGIGGYLSVRFLVR